MTMTALIGEKKALFVVCVFIISSILLVGCGGGQTTTVTMGETTGKSVEKNSTVSAHNGQGEEIVSPAPAPIPTPPATQEVNCGIGAFNVLNCTNQGGEQFSCSGDSHAVGSSYGCTDPEGNQFECTVVVTRMGGFTLSCARPLQ